MTGIVSPEELEQRMFALHPDQFLELYRLYEKLGNKANVQPEMQILRRRLVRMRPVRALTFSRLLCQPFEEFLVNEVTGDNGLIMRRSCSAIARLVRRKLAPDLRRRFEQRLAHLNHRPEDRAGQILLGREIWKAAAVALARELERRHGDRILVDKVVRVSIGFSGLCCELFAHAATLHLHALVGPLFLESNQILDIHSISTRH